MEGESGATRSINGELILRISKDIKGKLKVVIHEVSLKLHSWGTLEDEMEGESGVTRSIIDECHFWISKAIKCKVKLVLLEVSLKNFILEISKEIKWKVKVL